MSLFAARCTPRRAALGPWATLAVLAGTACSSTPTAPPPPPAPVTIEQPGRHLVSVGERQSGATIVLDAAQELRVRLLVEPLQVTADLDWVLVALKPGVLTGGPSRFERLPRDSNNEELAGVTVWDFTPASPGTVAMTFELRHRRKVESAMQTVTYTVRVK